MKFEALLQKYETAKRVQSELIEQLNEAGGDKGCVEMSLNFSAMLFNAQKDVTKIQNKVRAAFADNKITVSQYKQVFK